MITDHPGLRLGMVTTRARPDIGGIEAHVGEVARRLAERGHRIEVLTTDRTRRLPRRETVDGYSIRRFRAYPRSRDWYFSPGLVLAVLRGRYDLVHVQGIHTLVPPLAMIASILRRAPFVLTFHTGGSSSGLRRRARSTQWRILAPLLARAQVLIGVSRFEADSFNRVLGADGVRTIRNGGSLPALAEPPQVDPALIVTAGRLEHYKGHHRAIEMLPELLRTHPDAHLEILGSGPYEAELHALAERLQVADRVSIRFVPPTDRQAMAQSLARAAVVLLLSDYEAHPVAVMEALAAGRPVVVRRTSGLTEMADQGLALGVSADASPETVASAVATQLDTPLVPDQSTLPTWETCVDQLDVAYRDALSTPDRVTA